MFLADTTQSLQVPDVRSRPRLRCRWLPRRIHWARRQAISETPADDPFDADFVSELEGLVVESGVAVSSAAPAAALQSLQEALGRFAAPLTSGGAALDENAFVSLPAAVLVQRSNDLIESCRRSASREAALGVESFIVFFQTLAPTLRDEPAREVKVTFFRLAPTLVHMAWDEAAGKGDRRRDAGEALQGLETILLEVSSVHLTPAEGELLFKSLDQMATLLAAGEYGLARDVVGAPLLAILRKNRVSRSLFRLMEVEAAVQVYLKERFGYSTPQLRVPEDLGRLGEFGPIRIFEDQEFGGDPARYLQVQLPDIPILSDIVIRLSREGGTTHDLRLDGLGSTRFDLPPGLYNLGLIYEPEEPGGV